MVTSQYCTRQMTTADTFFRSFPSDKMFVVSRFVVAPSGTVSTGAQNRGARRSGAATSYPSGQISCCWRAQRQIIISFAADTVLHGTSADDGVHTRRRAAWSVIMLDANFVVML